LRGAAAASLAAAAFAWRREELFAIAIGAIALGGLWLAHSRQTWSRVEDGSRGQRIVLQLLRFVDAACLAAIAAMVVGPWFVLGLAACGLAMDRNRWLTYFDRRFALSPVARGVLTAGLIAIAATVAGGGLLRQAIAGRARLKDWTNDPVFARLSQGTGLTLTASRIPLIQLQTRRGVLLYGAAMNQITYVPSSGPKMNEILRKVYGDDILAPRPANWIPCGGLMRASGRELWAQRDLDEWIRLAREFGFSDVVTYADWTAKLPLVARNEKYALYHVPDSEPAQPTYAAAASGAATR
jgi:hypothetical protein